MRITWLVRDDGEDAETVEFEITSFKDPSGNELSTSEIHSSDESGYSVIVDTTSPTVSGISFSSSNRCDPDYPIKLSCDGR